MTFVKLQTQALRLSASECWQLISTLVFSLRPQFSLATRPKGLATNLVGIAKTNVSAPTDAELRRLRPWQLLFLIMQCLWVVGMESSAAIAQERVLVLHSYHSELAWTRQEKAGIDQGFQNSELDIKLFHEFMDLKRYPEAAHADIF